MTKRPHFVIVGASLAGATAAQTLREEGFDGRITLLGAERHRPYERPPLSKDYLLGKAGRDTVFVHPENWYADHDVELLVDTEVTALDKSARHVTTAAGPRWEYDKLLLATGSTPRHLTVPGADLHGVHYLRLLDDSDRIKEGFKDAHRVAIVGAGWIGLEAAAAARASGLDVTLLETAELPLLRVLGREVAPVFADLHRDHGVDLRCSVEVAELTGMGGAVTGVRLGDGDVVDADMVLVGVGIMPNSGLAAQAGLDVGDGITVDEHLRTSDPDIFAAGDVANAFHPTFGRHVRVEHWANAQRQGGTAAKAMLGRSVDPARPPYFFSDQFDLGMEYTGYVGPTGYDSVVCRGSLESREFVAFWLGGDQVLAGMNVNTWDIADPIEELVQSGRHVDVGQLSDPAIPLEQL